MSEVSTKKKQYPYAKKLTFIAETESLVKDTFLNLPNFINGFYSHTDWAKSCFIVENNLNFTIKILSEVIENTQDADSRAMLIQKVLQCRDMKAHLKEVGKGFYKE
jgi:hypothetical protein